MKLFHSALIVDTNAHSDLLTRREFIWPIQRALPIPCRVVPLAKFTPKSLEGADVVILSGCTLKDDAYVKFGKKLAWLAHASIPVLGICAGQQLISLAFGGAVRRMKKPAIGVLPVRATQKHSLLDDVPPKFNVYFLHGNEASVPKGFRSIAKSKLSAHDILVHDQKPVAGISFHPEVLNKDLFSAFLRWAETFPEK